MTLKTTLRNVLVLMLGLGGMTPALAQKQPGPSAPTAVTATTPGGRPRAKLSGVANLNQASPEVLELLPGIGPARAQAIVEVRQRRPFKKVDELVRIKGIGRKTMAKLRPYLTVSGQSTLVEEKADTFDEEALANP